MTAVAAVLAVVVSAQDPGAFEASFERGLAALAAGEYASAVESFEDALRIQPDHTQARFNLARALRELGEGAKALDQLLAIEDRMVDR
ncbi:MAG TPA: tetratricopeptide repeat protein, partial [Vicinamibacteria bacterium]|nr:tetratricopeptide repeat protein [Vicinamibacteria bacterium]